MCKTKQKVLLDAESLHEVIDLIDEFGEPRLSFGRPVPMLREVNREMLAEITGILRHHIDIVSQEHGFTDIVGDKDDG